MLYVYNCFAGTHSSALAAAYHLDKLPKDREPTREEILGIDIFNRLTPGDFGRFIYHGKDENGHKVYTVGRGKSTAVIPALHSFISLLQDDGKEIDQIVFSNCSPTVPVAMTFGGLFSRRFGIDFIGVPLLIRGAKQAHRTVIQLVEHTKAIASTTEKHIEILENEKFKVSTIKPDVK
ncbi:DUF3189 family protein [Alkalihalobacterium chitinilyticum]|uniref:DUF3189 family protein n=1 Tax=Alkalihalobacterium chitinilyticum TaxID=2980103 RepID=A0ABT5VFP0_9BACI|nr:DUF3189 family protein [Alkalihalobacterium chitinilyticum]MDE5413532.1 DUF3189 family protein [Alkalihalobacterium chitinilyticum]